MCGGEGGEQVRAIPIGLERVGPVTYPRFRAAIGHDAAREGQRLFRQGRVVDHAIDQAERKGFGRLDPPRSEESRGGKECVSTCRLLCVPSPYKNKHYVILQNFTHTSVPYHS